MDVHSFFFFQIYFVIASAKTGYNVNASMDAFVDRMLEMKGY